MPTLAISIFDPLLQVARRGFWVSRGEHREHREHRERKEAARSAQTSGPREWDPRCGTAGAGSSVRLGYIATGARHCGVGSQLENGELECMSGHGCPAVVLSELRSMQTAHQLRAAASLGNVEPIQVWNVLVWFFPEDKVILHDPSRSAPGQGPIRSQDKDNNQQKHHDPFNPSQRRMRCEDANRFRCRTRTS